jgi:cytosine deaminase
MDFIIRNARFRGKEEYLDIGVQKGKIVAIEKKILGKAKEEIDAKGRLTTPAFVNPHVHPDKSFVGDEADRFRTGAILEAFTLTHVFKRNYTMEDILKRAGKVMELAARYGCTIVRVFADIDTIGGLLPFKALQQLKTDYNDVVEIQVVAFPQEGIVKNPGSEELMKEAMEIGPDVVGGIPWFEMTDQDSKYHADFIFNLGRKYNKDIHFLEDDTDDPYSRGLEYTASKVIKEKFPRIVTVSHVEALARYGDAHADKVVKLVKEAGINVCSNPHISLWLASRLDPQPVARGVTRVKELLNAGVNVCSGQDDVNDPFYPFGKMDQLEVAFLAAHACQMTMPNELEKVFDMVTHNAAKALGIKDYGLDIGCRADIVIHEAESIKEALRMRLERVYVIKGGRVIAENGVVKRYNKPN